MSQAPTVLLRFLSSGAALPTLPEVAQQLLDSFNREDVTLGDLESLVRQDPALAARLLRVANSARYGMGDRITRLWDAAARVGVGPLRSLALGSCLANAFPTPPGFDRLRFWRQSLGTATFARWLAGPLELDADTAETAGLVMRCGQLLMLMSDADTAALVDVLIDMPDSVFELERQYFGCNHAELSAELAMRWQFPQGIVDGLRAAADPLTVDPLSVLGIALRAASVMSDAVCLGMEPLRTLQDIQPALVQRLGLNLAQLVKQVPDNEPILLMAGEMLL